MSLKLVNVLSMSQISFAGNPRSIALRTVLFHLLTVVSLNTVD